MLGRFKRSGLLTLVLSVFVFSHSFGALQAQAPEEAAELVRQNNVLANAAQNGTLGQAASPQAINAQIKARYVRMEKVLRQSPVSARKYALDAATRAALIKADAANELLLEKDTPLTGDLEAVVADDFEHHTATTLYRLHTTVADIALSPAAPLEGLAGMLHHHVTVTGVSLPDVVAAETVREASPVEAAACVQAVREVTSEARMTEALHRGTALNVGASVPAGSATASCSTFGKQTTAVVILNFTGGATYQTGQDSLTGWDAILNGPMPSVADFINQSSFGQTSLTADIYGPVTLPQAYGCADTDALAQAAFAAITGMVDFTRYNRYVFVFPESTCSFGGLDTEGCLSATTLIPQQYSIMWVPMTPVNSLTTAGAMWTDLSHELGHGMGANHGNTLDFGALSLGPIDYQAVNPGTINAGAGEPVGQVVPEVAVPAAGSTTYTAINTEYGDRFSMMGNGWTPAVDYAPQEKIQFLGWIPASSSQDITTSGNFTLSPAESNTGLRALHVLRDAATNSWFWVEFHQPIGAYATLSLGNLPANNLTTGALIHYQDGNLEPVHSYMMNMAPVAAPNNFLMSNLTPGSSWSDPYSLVTLTAGAQGTTLPITVSYDAPCAAVALDTSSLAAAGGTGNVTITAPASCNWSVSSNAAWISFTGNTTGSGNATVPYNYAANTGFAQRNSYLTAQRQSLPVVQQSTGITVVGLGQTTTTVASNVEATFVVNVTDAAGVADLQTINFRVAGNTNPDCFVQAFGNGANATLSIGALSGVRALTTGTPGTQVTPSCTLDAGNSSWVGNGNNGTLTVAVSFPAGMTGIHGISVVGFGPSGQTSSIPVGYVNVSATAPSAVVAPAVGTQGTTVPVTITGANTAFTAASTIAASVAGVTVTGVTYVSATSLTANVVIATTTTPGQYTLTVTSGAEVDPIPFTVNLIPNVSLSPNGGNAGATVNYTITGTNTNFSNATTVTVCGGTCGITSTVNYGSPTSLTGTFTIPQATANGAQSVAVTTGGQVLSASFNVGTAGVPSIIVSPASGSAGSTVPITLSALNMTLDGTTSYRTGTGVGVDFSTYRLVSPTLVSFGLKIDPAAQVGPSSVTVTTGNLTATATFTVTGGATPAVTVTPAAGAAGVPIPIMLSGTNTNFNVNTSLVSSGPGVSVSNATTLNNTAMSAFLIVDPTAHGPYTLTLTTGNQVVKTTFMANQLASATAAIAASAAALLPTQAAVLTASVAPSSASAGGVPSGTVTFYDTTILYNQLSLGTYPLVNGTATATIAHLAIGTHTYSVNYAGDKVFSPAVAASSATVVVAQAKPGLVLTGIPASVLYPATATGLSFTAALSSSAVAPTGTITFNDGAATLSTVALANGVAVLTGVNLGVGNHSITATYSGDSNFVAVTTLAQVVSVQDFSMAVSTSSVTIDGSGSGKDTITLSPVAGAFTQAISLTCSGAPADTTCSIASASLTPGSASATATVTIQTGVQPSGSTQAPAAGLLLFLTTGFLAVRKRRFGMHALSLLMVLGLALGFLVGCGGNSPSQLTKTPAGNYTLTITGTAAGTPGLTHATTVSLVVQ